MPPATQQRPRPAQSRPRPRRWLSRLAWALALAIMVVVLLPYLLVPLYRTVNPVSTLMLWRWAKGARGAKLRADRAHGAGAADDRDRVRGWPLLQPSRHRLARAARALGRRRRHQRGAGGLHHHPADGQESVPVVGTQFRAQGAGVPARAVDRLRAAQTACARNLSQHRGMGSERAIRRRGRQPLRLQQIRALAHPARGGVAGRGAAEPAAAQRQAAGAGGAPARFGLRGPRRGPGGARLLRAIRQIIQVLASSPLELEFSLLKRALKERLGTG